MLKYWVFISESHVTDVCIDGAMFYMVTGLLSEFGF